MKKGNRILQVTTIALTVVTIFISGFLAFNMFNKPKKFDSRIMFSLMGDSNISLNISQVYEEFGFIAINNKGIDLSNKVVITGSVPVNREGEYVISYSLTDDNGVTKTLKRIIQVSNQDIFTLNGDSNAYLLLGGEYKELGASIYYQKNDYSHDVSIDGTVDTSQEGVYVIKYSFAQMPNKTLTRTVYVSSFDDNFTFVYDKTRTNKDINISVNVNQNAVMKYILPNMEERVGNSNYVVSTNGNYNFIIYDKYGNALTRQLVIDNIIKEIENASCLATITDSKTDVVVNSNSTIVKYVYNGAISNTNKYTFNTLVSSVNVMLYDDLGNEKLISCQSITKSSKMEIHFIASGHYDDAILIRANDKNILIDGGRYNCSEKVVPYLKDVGVRNIDVMIGSHLHNDHIASQSAILDNFNVNDIWYPDDIKTCNIRNTCTTFDQEYIIDALNKYNKTPLVIKPLTIKVVSNMTFYFLQPLSLGSSQNGNSFIFILKFSNNTFMFTGDASSGEMNVNDLKSTAGKMGISLNVDILKYPHHGNQTLSDEFLNSINPQYTIIPNYNASKYPSDTNIKKLQTFGIKMYRQSDYGNILLESDGNNIKFITAYNPSNYNH